MVAADTALPLVNYSSRRGARLTEDPAHITSYGSAYPKWMGTLRALKIALDWSHWMFKLSFFKRLAAGGAIAAALFATVRINGQNLTLEGQTGGFITPTAYVVLSDKDHLWSHPAVGYHFVNASSVIGYVYTF